jgi:hypothetical protein
MKTVTLNTIFLLLTVAAFGQVQLLKDYDFDKGGYSLLGIRSESDPSGLADTLGEFYTDDISVLKQFQKEWIFKKPSPQYACGYHYIVYVCKNGLEIESFSINLNCNEIATKKGYFFFETQKLRMFKNKVKKPLKKNVEFTSVTLARNVLKRILVEKNLIMTYKPDWTKYEGEFSFDYTCKAGTGDCLDNEIKLLVQLTEEIKKVYPNETFDLTGGGGSRTELFVNIKCNKTLADKFKLYPIGWKKWESYDIELTSYWRTK